MIFVLLYFHLGGENTVLNETSFEGVTPKKRTVETPNVVLGTPFRTPGQPGVGSTPGRMMTPQMGSVGIPGSMTPGQTPVRDHLQINPEDALSEGFDSMRSAKQQQYEVRAQLRAGLSSLPAPRNDFEIVVPDQDGHEGEDMAMEFVEDAAEIDERRAQARREEGERCCEDKRGTRGGVVEGEVERGGREGMGYQHHLVIMFTCPFMS